MRKKSNKTDRLINVEDDFSDYDSSTSNNEVDVKEALRSTISSNLLKNKYQKGDYPTSMLTNSSLVPTASTIQYMYRNHNPQEDFQDRRIRQDDEMSAVSSNDSIVDIGTTSSSPHNTVGVISSTATRPPSKKEKKQKKPEDQETAAMRRERNRLAAQRCRQRRRDRIDKLEKICERLENDGEKLETEISVLQSEMSNLQKILNDHKCMAMPPRIKSEREYYKYDNRMVST